MEELGQALPIIIYFLLIILLIALIILVVKLIQTLKKVDKVIEDVNYKCSQLNGIFHMADVLADTISNVSDRMITSVSHFISSLWKRKKRKKEDRYYE